MDRPTADSDSFDGDSAARVSLGNLAGQPANAWRSTPNAGAATEDLGFIWTRLCAGELRIVRHAQEELQTTLDLEERRADDRSRWAIRGRALAIFQRVLTGQNLNFIALDLDLSSSTVSAAFQLAMRAFELKPRLSGLPMYLPQLWHASRACPVAEGALLGHGQGSRYATVSLPRPDLHLAGLLSRAELEVTGMLLQGKTHAEIAAARGTSARTVANQLASIFAKLNVSGRLELITTLARGLNRFQATPLASPRLHN